jgi:YVTN family beta-propeller protein
MFTPDQFKTSPDGAMMQTDPSEAGLVIAVGPDGTLTEVRAASVIPDATPTQRGLQSATGKRIELQQHESCKYQLLAAAIATFDPAHTSAADWDGAVAGAAWTADVAAQVRLLNQSTNVIYTLTTATTCTATGETALHDALLSVSDSVGNPRYRDTAATGAATPVFVPATQPTRRINGVIPGSGLVDDSARVSNNLAQLRQEMIRYDFGSYSLPAGLPVITSLGADVVGGMQNWATVDRWYTTYSMPMVDGTTGTTVQDNYHYAPATRSKNVCIWLCCGHGGFADSLSPYPVNGLYGISRWMRALLIAGYDVVISVMQYTYAHNECFWKFPASDHGCGMGIMLVHGVQCINQIATMGFAKIYAMGHSGGGWMSVHLTALDPRIDAAYANAHGIPLYMRQVGVNEGDGEQINPDFYSRFGYLDLYALSAEGRLLDMTWLTHDSVFGPSEFSNTTCGLRARTLTFAQAVTDFETEINAAVTASGGSMVTTEDTVATTHQVTYQTIKRILTDMLPGPASNAWVSDYLDDSLSQIDVATQSVVGSMHLPTGAANPCGSCVDWGKQLFVGCDSGHVCVLNLNTLAWTKITVGVGGCQKLAYDNDKHVWAVNRSAGTVSVIDIDTLAVVATITVGTSSNLQDVCWDGNSYMIVAEMDKDKIARLDIATRTLHDEIAVDAGPTALTWGGGPYVYIGNTGGNWQKMTVSSGALSAPVALGGSSYGSGWDGGNYVYFSLLGSGYRRLRLSDDTLMAAVNIPGVASARMVGWDGWNHMMIGNSSGTVVTAVSVSTGAIDSGITVGSHPWGISWDKVYW